MHNSNYRTFQPPQNHPTANPKRLALAALAFACALLALEAGRAQAAVLGTEDFTASGGISDIFHEFHPTLALAPAATSPGRGASAPATNAPLFRGTSITPADVGKTFTATPDTDSNFSDFAAFLTDGNSHKATLAFGSGTLGTTHIFSTKNGDLFGGNPALKGNAIDSISLRVDSFTLDTPGTNPNGDRVWTDYAFNGTVTVNGQSTGSAPLTVSQALVTNPSTTPVPEPNSAFGTLAFGFGAFSLFPRCSLRLKKRLAHLVAK